MSTPPTVSLPERARWPVNRSWHPPRLPVATQQFVDRLRAQGGLPAFGIHPGSPFQAFASIRLPRLFGKQSSNVPLRDEQEEMRRALLHFVSGLTDTQRRDAFDVGMTADEAANTLRDGWPDQASMNLLRILRGQNVSEPEGNLAS